MLECAIQLKTLYCVLLPKISQYNIVSRYLNDYKMSCCQELVKNFQSKLCTLAKLLNQVY